MTTTEQLAADPAAGGVSPTDDAGSRGRGSSSMTESSRRAYERRQRRTQKVTGSRIVGPGKPVKTALNRAPFVVVLIALLGAGIVAVLYLNTVTDEAGIRTSTAKSTTVDLRLTIESLQRDVALLDATPRIAGAAAALGMVPAGDSALLMVDGSGAGSVIGDPSVVAAPVDPAAAAAAKAAQDAAAAAAAVAPAAPPVTATPPVDPAAEAAAAAAAAAAPGDPAAAAAAAPTDPAASAAAQAATDAATAQAATDAAALAQAQGEQAAAAAGPPADPAAPATEPGTPAQGAQQ
ncbi:MAG: hypothetical protein ABJD68_06310 [Nakamurella sp.]